MSKAPLFSTYRQGENRVTSSILAVLDRIDFGRVEELLAAASGESALEMVRFVNQPRGDRSVPDAAIAASFHYLFEVKTVPNNVGAGQLREHLRMLDGGAKQELLFVLTPDVEPPAAVSDLDDARVVWLNFVSLAQAVDALLDDRASTISEREGFLLRELQGLFEAEGLLGAAEDVVVVAARHAYPNYLKYGVLRVPAGPHLSPRCAAPGLLHAKGDPARAAAHPAPRGSVPLRPRPGRAAAASR